ERRTEYMRSSPIAAGRIRRLRVKSRQRDVVEWPRFRSPLADQEGTPIDVAVRCITMQTVANGGGRLIPTNSTTIAPFSSADRRRKIASNEVPDQCGNGHRLTPDNVSGRQRRGPPAVPSGPRSAHFLGCRDREA